MLREGWGIMIESKLFANRGGEQLPEFIPYGISHHKRVVFWADRKTHMDKFHSHMGFPVYYIDYLHSEKMKEFDLLFKETREGFRARIEDMQDVIPKYVSGIEQYFLHDDLWVPIRYYKKPHFSTTKVDVYL